MQNIQHPLPVLSNQKISKRFYKLRLKAVNVYKKAQPGQFVHVRISDGLEPFFRRPFSIHRMKNNLEVFYDVIGQGTQLLSQRKPGDVLDVLGPLGNGFALPPKGIKQVVMIAGGIGVAPFLFLSDQLKKSKCQLTLLYGGRNKEYTFPMTEFKKNKCRVYISTDDGSVGVRGRVSKLFSKISVAAQTTFIYACGPRPMMAGVQKLAKERGFAGQVSCEEVMACGLGACLGCAVETKEGYKTACHDGPVFDLDQVVF